MLLVIFTADAPVFGLGLPVVRHHEDKAMLCDALEEVWAGAFLNVRPTRGKSFWINPKYVAVVMETDVPPSLVRSPHPDDRVGIA